MSSERETGIRVGQVAVPGDVVGEVDSAVRVGYGLLQDGGVVKATKAGVVRGVGVGESGMMYWVDAAQKRYVPARGDLVVGTVVGRHGENYAVDVGCAAQAGLPLLGFEGATKRNRPALEVGDLVYGRVVLADKDMDPEMVCTDARGKAAGFGPLEGGYLVDVSLPLVSRLFDPDAAVLAALGKRLPYEVALGINGKVWIHAASPLHTILIANAILNSEFLNDTEVHVMVERLLAKLK